MKKYLLGLLLVCASVQAQIVTVPIPGASGLSITVGVGVNAQPLRDIRTNPAAVNITQGDDSWTEVPLGFSFPFWNKTFTTSWAMTNGMITFQDPSVSGMTGACCAGINLTTTNDPKWNYSIFAVHSDLYSFNPNSQYYLRENNAITYGWYNLSQCCDTVGGNSFEIKITSSGTVDTRIAGARVSLNPVTSGMSGDLTKGEFYQYYHGQGLNILPGSPSIFSWNTNGGFTGADPCTTNILSSPACPGYQQAYLTQQCTISALYDPSCPNYNMAYVTEQVLTPQQKTPEPTIQPTINQVEQQVPTVNPVPIVPIVQQPTSTPGSVGVIQQPVVQPPMPEQSQTSQQPTTLRQQLQKARVEASRKQAAAKTSESMKEAAEAKTIEQQVAAQNSIIAAMGYNPQFDAYNSVVIQDRIFYKSLEIYKGKENIDNSRALRGLYGASDIRHKQLTDQQYK